MGRHKGSKDKTKRKSHDIINCQCGGCKNRRKEHIKHKFNCTCSSCKMKRKEFHSDKCICISCKNKNGISHKIGCCCVSCETYRHNNNCLCNFCKATRGENIGIKNGMFGRHFKHSLETKLKISKKHTGRKLKKQPDDVYKRGIETRKKNGWYKDREATISKMSKPKTDQHIKNILKSVQSKPNNFEVKALRYINSIYKNKFLYTGDGSLIVNNRSADAYAEELNTICLFNGVYWHLKKFGYEINKNNKKIIEAKESVPFISAGYKVIFVWEDEI